MKLAANDTSPWAQANKSSRQTGEAMGTMNFGAFQETIPVWS
jgi:hypothetical protein